MLFNLHRGNSRAPRRFIDQQCRCIVQPAADGVLHTGDFHHRFKSASGIRAERLRQGLAVRFDCIGQAGQNSQALTGTERAPGWLGRTQAGGTGGHRCIAVHGHLVIDLAGSRVAGRQACRISHGINLGFDSASRANLHGLRRKFRALWCAPVRSGNGVEWPESAAAAPSRKSAARRKSPDAGWLHRTLWSKASRPMLAPSPAR